MRIFRILAGVVLFLVFAVFTSVVWQAYNEKPPLRGDLPIQIKAEGLPYKTTPEDRGGLPVINEESSLIQALDFGEDEQVVERLLPYDDDAPKSPSQADPALGEQVLTGFNSEKELVAAIKSGTLDQNRQSTGTSQIRDLSSDDLGPVELDIAPIKKFAASERALPTEPTIGEDEVNNALVRPEPSVPSSDSASASDIVPNVVENNTNTDSVVTRPTALETGNAENRLPVIQPPRGRQSTSEAQPENSEIASLGSASDIRVIPEQFAASPIEEVSTRPLILPSGDRYRMQIAAVRNEEQARTAWSRLVNSYEDVLGQLELHVQRGTTDRGVFYRVQAKGFAEFDEAAEACNALKELGGDCFVVSDPQG